MLCSCMALSIMAFTASHALAPLFSRNKRDICSALNARCRSGLSNIGFRSSESTCMIAWKDAKPPAKVSYSSRSMPIDKPICHWKRAASTSTDAPLIVSMQFTDFSKILYRCQLTKIATCDDSAYDLRMSLEKTTSLYALGMRSQKSK